ncbi:hypothetical protein EJB05_02825, partial [Eragrostis curvula]
MASPHIAVVAFPFSSHGPKLLALARALAAAAPSATFSFLISSCHDSVASLHGTVPPANLKLVEVPCPGWDKDTPAWQRIELFLDAAESGGLTQALDAAASNAGGQKVTCVVGDAFMSMAAAAGIPWVAVWTGGPCALLAHIHGDAIRRDLGKDAATRGDEFLTSYPGLGCFRVRDLPWGDPDIHGDIFRVMDLLLRRVAERLPRAATATALNFFPGLFPQDVPAALADAIPNRSLLPIGPFHHLIPAATAVHDKHGCLAWLDRHPPTGTVAYVSFGTAVVLPPDELRELALGLQDAGAPFLWSLREESWPLLPPGFLDRAKGSRMVVPWTPQAAVLRHPAVGAFVTHAGWGAVVEAMSGGVPMLCRPFFGDQMMNARSVECMWGFGRAIADGDAPLTRGAVAAAVASLLTGEEASPIRARARGMQAMVVRAFEPDGGSTINFRKLVDIISAAHV